jgi:hypothetical protein
MEPSKAETEQQEIERISRRDSRGGAHEGGRTGSFPWLKRSKTACTLQHGEYPYSNVRLIAIGSPSLLIGDYRQKTRLEASDDEKTDTRSFRHLLHRFRRNNRAPCPERPSKWRPRVVSFLRIDPTFGQVQLPFSTHHHSGHLQHLLELD